MNEIVDIVGLALLASVACAIGVLIGSKFEIAKETLLGTFFASFAGVILGLSIYIHILDSNKAWIGVVPGLAIFFAVVVTKYLETSKITTEAILGGLGMLIGFTIGSLLYYLVT